MKKIYFLSGLTISLMATSCGGNRNTAADNADTAKAQAEATCPSSAYNEPELEYGNMDLMPNVYLYRSWEIATGESQFEDNFKYQNSTTNFPRPLFKMQYATLKSIFDSLDKVRPQGVDHIAIRFYYGIQDQAMDLILQPIFLTPVPGNHCEEYSQQEVDIFYSLRQKRGISHGEMLQLTQAYRDNVYIKHVDATTVRFIDTTDFFRGDTHYALTPFQQVFRMHCDNKGAATDSISFQIVADSFYRSNGSKVNNFKLHVVSFLEGKVTNGSTTTNSFAGFSADFDQMCPPKCSTNLRLNYYTWMSNTQECVTFNKAPFVPNGPKVINVETPQ